MMRDEDGMTRMKTSGSDDNNDDNTTTITTMR